MAIEPSHIADLLLRLHRGTLSETGQQELEAWAAASAENADLYRELTEEGLVQEGLRQIESYDEARVRERILAQLPDAFPAALPAEIPLELRLPARHRWMIRWSAAAILVLLAGAGSYFLFFNKHSQAIATTQTQAERFKNDVAPGGNKATLTLAGGKQIVLDSAVNGVLTQQGNAQVQKLANGQLAYSLITGGSTAVLYNTLATPRGGQYQLALPDGSKVWLNAESSIKYPVFFPGGERKVEISGEAYFEVRKNASQPFKVVINGRQEVDVLGTSFNVNAYPDEPQIKTTLLEGSVRVRVREESLVGVNTGKEKLSLVLKPGEQAELVVGAGNGLRIVGHVDVDAVIAWKNGLFRFKGAELQAVMRQIARWYDVEVEYQGKLPDYPLVGNIPRNEPVSEILKLLELTGVVHFKIDGRKVTVMP